MDDQDEHDQIVRDVIRQLEMPSDFSAVGDALTVVALVLIGGYFALRWLDPVMETQLALLR
jgi:hypothetical protein